MFDYPLQALLPAESQIAVHQPASPAIIEFGQLASHHYRPVVQIQECTQLLQVVPKKAGFPHSRLKAA